jgi:hypothetical protein
MRRLAPGQWYATPEGRFKLGFSRAREVPAEQEKAMDRYIGLDAHASRCTLGGVTRQASRVRRCAVVADSAYFPW